MADRSFLTQEYARQCVDYDADTGKITWRERPKEHFAKEWRWRTWNAEHAGNSAFSSLHTTGYLKGYVCNVRFYAHQIIWVWLHGVWPEEVDHINGKRSDNRLCNLRAVSRQQNMRNQALRSDNTSGHAGVHTYRGKWRACIQHEGRTMKLGSFSDYADAVSARKAAEQRLGYHPNHGRIA